MVLRGKHSAVGGVAVKEIKDGARTPNRRGIMSYWLQNRS